MKAAVKRYELLDIVRGTAILAMVAHHAAYDIVTFYNIKIPFLNSSLFEVLHFIFAGAFIAVAGITSNFSRSNVRRGLYCLGAGLIVTIVSVIASPDYPIYFGILQFMGFSMLIYGLLQKYFERIPDKIAAVLWAVLFCVNYYIYETMGRVDIPYLFPLGIVSHNFAAGDYYPFLPYFWLFLLGTLIGKLIAAGDMPNWFYRVRRLPVVSYIGKHSLIVYLVHQPIVIALLWLILGNPF